MALVLPLTAGCAANFSAETQVQYQPAVGSDTRETDIYVLNALVVADDEGDGTLVATMINQASEPDILVDFQAVDASSGAVETSKLPPLDASALDLPADVSAPDSGVALPSQQPTKLPDDATLQLTADTVTAGTFVTVTFRFQNAGPIELDVPVVAEDPIYDGVSVGPIEQQTDAATSTTP